MKKWTKILLVILSVLAVSVGLFFVLKSLGITNIEGIRQLMDKAGAWSWIVFILVFVLGASLLCFIPGTSATLIAVSIVMFGATKGFIISTISVFLSSSLLFMLGNTLGEKAAIKLVGKESLEKAQNLLDMKSKMFLPLMFLFPIFPDDALCLVAGMTKMRFWYFAVIVAIFRTVGVGTICFLGGGLIDWSTLSLIDWFVVISVCIFWLILIFKYQNKIEGFILKRRSKQKKIEKKLKYSPNARLANLEKLREGVVNKIEKCNETIRLKKYTCQSQLDDINKKIRKLQAEKVKIDNRIENEKKVVEPSAKKSEMLKVQDYICDLINNVMKTEFKEVKYSVKYSLTTTSVYLTLTNENGVDKTIRFSDHYSARANSGYKINNATSYKAMKTIIEKSLKTLQKKTVYVLLNRLKNTEDKC